MVVLGIDPGTRRIGYGIVRKDGGAVSLLAAGILAIRSTNDPSALRETKKQIDSLLRRFRPAVVAVEKLFFAKNRTTALQVAQARGVVLLAAAERGLPIREYAPNEIKLGITGYGLADKAAVLKMVRAALGKPSLKLIDDASDALAIAIFAANLYRE